MALTDLRPSPGAVPTSSGGPRRVPQRERRLPERHLARLALAIAGLLAALAGLHVLLEGVWWWFAGALFAIVIVSATTVARALMRSLLLPPLVGLIAGVMLVTLSFARETAILGVIPTFDTVARLQTVVDSGIASIVEQRAPATAEVGIVMLIAALTGLCAWAAEIFVASHAPAMVALPFAAVLIVPMVVRSGLTDPLWFVVAAVCFLALLHVDTRRDSRPAVALTGLIALVAALLAPGALPRVGEEASSPVGGLTAGLNPLITLGDDLRRGDPVLALTYTSTASGPVYLRLTTLGNFTGDTWGPALSDVAQAGDIAELPEPPGLGTGIPREQVDADVRVSQVRSRWLPVPYPATGIEGVSGAWYTEPDGLTIRSDGDSARGQDYTVQFLEVDPTDAQLAETVVGGTAPRQSLDLPDDVPEIIGETARTVTAGGGSAYDKALALQNYLRSEPFTYSEDAPVEEGFDGSGMDALAVFLDRKTGYCVHYASAMAVMAREVGIPSRIAVGFQPGERDVRDGRSQFVVSSNDLHAWPELYFEGIGWLRFEPTPGRGSVPSYGSVPVDDPATPEDESTATPVPTSSATPGARPQDENLGADPATPAETAASATGVGGGIALGLLVVALIPAVIRLTIRRMRYARIRSGRDPARAAWDELRDTAHDHGWTAPLSETPRGFADRLTAAVGDGAGLAALRGSVEVAAYGRPDAGAVTTDEVQAARRTIARASDLRTRLGAIFLPSSLLKRWRPDD
ncbi:DUF3488 and transglutaminase-like domain-containing protein [Homoserinibacter sp. GY 40078]|uniref:transglutaminase family protein n=1 Tax=Homoserinibacter sp. GY 40078 TaxID=2603275 RepID=UPI0016503B88|nr:DUF3488 and transglutaminase-like domain-containing protein [Homoserinibacter sp. GY 40078]